MIDDLQTPKYKPIIDTVNYSTLFATIRYTKFRPKSNVFNLKRFRIIKKILYDHNRTFYPDLKNEFV